MKRATADNPLNDLDQLRNRLISKRGFPGGPQFAFIKRIFRSAHVMVTRVRRVHVKMVSLHSLSTYPGYVLLIMLKLSQKSGSDRAK